MKEKNKYQRTINKKNEEHRNIVEEVSYINLLLNIKVIFYQ